MSAAATEGRAERVLVLMTNRKDAERTADVLAAAGLEAVACTDGPHLCRELPAGAGALLLTEEAILGDRDRCIPNALAAQPTWSSIPLVAVVREGAAVDPRDSLRSDFAVNVTLIERPVRMRTLVSVVRGALRARRHQYETRDAIAERERQADALRESRERLRLMVESAADYAIFTTDPDGVVTTWNAGAEAVFGWSEAEIVGRQSALLFTPEDRAAGVPEQEIRTAAAAGRAADERWHLRKDGTRFFATGTVTPLRDGTLRGFTKVARDITDRVLAEERVREAEERFEFVRRSSGVGFWYCDLPFDVLEWDDQVKAHFHLPPDAPVTIGTFYDRIHPDDREPTRAAIEQSITDQTPYDTDYRTVDPATGAVKWVRAIGRTFYAADGTPRRFDGVTLDVSDRKRTEQRLRTSEQRYRTLFESIDEGFCVIEVLFDPSDDGRAVDYRFLEVNPAFESQAGMTDVIGRRMLEFVPDIEEHWLDNYGRVALTGAAVRFSNEYKGLNRWFEVYAFRLGGDESRKVAVLFKDISDRKRAEEALKESERRFREMADASPAMLWLTDPDGHCTFLSRRWYEYTGQTEAEALGLGWTTATHPDDAEQAGRIFLAANAAREIFRTEYRLRGRDGEYRWAIDVGRPWFSASGEYLGMIGVVFDIDDRKRAEQALRDQYDVTRAITDNATTAVFMMDSEGRATFMNPAAEAMTGFRFEEFEGKVLHDQIHHHRPDGRPFPIEECPIGCSVMAKNVLRGHEDVFIRKDGSFVPVRCSASPVLQDGELTGIVLEAVDITEAKRAEQALREAHTRLEERVRERTEELARANDFLQALLENVQDGIVACDAEGRLTLFNRATRDFHGLPQESVPPAEWVDHYDLYRGDGRTPMPLDEVPLFRALAGERVRDAEMVIAPRKNGPPRWLRASGQAFYDAEGGKLGAVVSMHDVTEKRSAEEELRRSHERTERLVEERTAELAAANAALRDADRRKDEFLAMLAHELRNPLAPIRTGLDLLAMQGIEPDVIAPMQEQVEHVVRLVDDLLDVSRIMRGKVDLKKEPVDLAAVANRAAAAVRPAIDAHRQRLFVELPAEPVRLEADAVRLTQVVSNLVGNASKYTPDGGEIRLSVRREDGTAVVTVADTGLGIAPELLPKVFDLFIQAEQSLDRAQGGLGIGLTVVKSLVELHGGTVTATSDGPGRGSEFTVRLPVLSPAEAAPAAKAWPAAAACRVLVVDDNAAAAKLLSVLLRKLGEHDVAVAHDGEAAIEAALVHRPDLVLLDIGLPRLDGFEVARRLRQKPEFRNTLLVALTGYGSPEDRAKSLEAGFDAHLVKPPGVDMLRKVLAHPKLSTT